jgi:hypothetical protein
MAENVEASNFKLAVSPTHLVFSEIIAVTSAMRKNSRWASAQPGPARVSGLASSMGLRTPPSGHGVIGRGEQDRREAILMAGFDQLKREIRDAESMYLSNQAATKVRIAHNKVPIRYNESACPYRFIALLCNRPFATFHWTNNCNDPFFDPQFLSFRFNLPNFIRTCACTREAQQCSRSLQV